jgi:hypothetical protein
LCENFEPQVLPANGACLIVFIGLVLRTTARDNIESMEMFIWLDRISLFIACTTAEL